jgi:hypothetical protein
MGDVVTDASPGRLRSLRRVAGGNFPAPANLTQICRSDQSMRIDRQGDMKLNVSAFALACGIIWGLGLFALTWWIIAFDGSTHEITLIGRIYRGYDISPLGSLVGLVWGFFDALIGGAIFAWLYNRLSRGRSSTDH